MIKSLQEKNGLNFPYSWSTGYTWDSRSSTRYKTNHESSPKSSDSSIVFPKQTKIQKLYKIRYFLNCFSVLKERNGYYSLQKCVKKKIILMMLFNFY